MNVCDKCLAREPDAGNPHVRFDEGEGGHPQGWPPLYSTVVSFVDPVSDKARDKARDKEIENKGRQMKLQTGRLAEDDHGAGGEDAACVGGGILGGQRPGVDRELVDHAVEVRCDGVTII